MRVYASLRLGPAGGASNVPATLEAIVPGGASLGTIQPIARPAVVRVGDRTVDPVERADPAGAYTFVLPDGWTNQPRVDLIARVNPAGIGCDLQCQSRSTFYLTGVQFAATVAPTVAPYALTDNGRLPVNDPGDAFDLARLVTPLDLQIFGRYAGVVEIGDILNTGSITVRECFIADVGIDANCSNESYAAGSPEFRQYAQGVILDRLEEAADDASLDDCDIINIGLVRQNSFLPGVMREAGTTGASTSVPLVTPIFGPRE